MHIPDTVYIIIGAVNMGGKTGKRFMHLENEGTKGFRCVVGNLASIH